MPDYPTDADKYRILPERLTDCVTDWDVRQERDRRQAEYIAASEAYWEDCDLNLLPAFDAAREALLKHMEDHP